MSQPKSSQSQSVPVYLRVSDLVGVREVTAQQAAINREREVGPRRARHARNGLLPFSTATLWRRVREGAFPQPVKLSAGVTAWRQEDVQAWMAERNGA